MTKKTARWVVLAAGLALVAAACGSDKKSTGAAATTTAAGTSATTAAGATTTAKAAATTAAATTVAGADITARLDANGDGKVVFGIAAAGPADDGAYYQAVVDAAKELSKEHGFGDPVVVDNIKAADAATAIGDLAQQNVDVVIVGASEIAEPLPQLIAQYPKLYWYCNCGAGFPPNPGLAQSTDDGAEISYTAGYATGLLLKQKGGDSVVFIGCCDLGFEKQAYMAFEKGLQAVDPSYKVTYVPTGDFPFDFDNTANATAALQTAIDNGADAVYPYLGGAHRPVVQAANEKGLITMSAGSSTVCGPDEKLKYDIAVQFDGGDYVRAVMNSIIAGTFKEGDTKKFKVGIDPEPGAHICKPTPEQAEAMKKVFDQIAAGDFADEFGQISAKAFGSG